MALDAKRVRTLLQEFDLQKLFVEELGWDRHQATFDVTLDGHTNHLAAVAHKRGVIAFLCKPETAGELPDYATRRKIERLVAKTYAEHLIVFVDPKKATQIWQWIKREPGRPAASREHTWHKAQSGEALIQKLGHLVFTLDEEENVTILDSTGRVRAGFDIERVTKRFYDRFKTEHDAFAQFIKGIPDGEMHLWYVSVMLNRLMFIYFIQKKGFLNGDPAYLRTKLAASKQAGKDRFYKEFLCLLFFEGFAVKEDERAETTRKLLGNVPYLNGGLFLRHQIEEHCGETIQIADAAFDRIFEFFDSYQWHLDERPLRQDNEINPDVLGYIFEKYINQKQMGAYYTKEDITEYNAKNTIIPFLFDAAKEECPIAFKRGSFLRRLLREDPDRYIYPAVRKGVIDPRGKIISLPAEIEAGIADVSKRGSWNKPADPSFALPTETWREHVARRQHCLEIRRKLRDGEVHDINEFITLNLDIRQFAQDVIENSEGPELVRAFYQAIEKITVLDPTCGSGAFLFAALNVLQPLYEACLERMAALVAEAETGKSDLRSERCTDFRKVLERITRHPNHDYFVLKSIIVNNLYGVDIMEEAVEICKLRLFLKLVAQVEKVEQIEPLPDIDFNIRAGNTLVGYATQADAENNLNFGNAISRIAQKAAVFDLLFQKFRRHQLEDGSGASTQASRQFKQDMLTPLTELRQELDEFLAVAHGQAGKGKFEPWRKSHQPFHWFVEFYGIMRAGGFDVIIGNPPWAEYAKVKKVYRVKGYSTEKCGNLHGFCTERSLQIRNSAGRLSFIVQLPLTSSSRMATVRAVLRAHSRLLHVIPFDDRPGKLFEGLQHCRSVIFFSSMDVGDAQTKLFTTRYQRWPTEARSNLFESITFSPRTTRPMFDGHFPKISSVILEHVLDRVRERASATVGIAAVPRESEHFVFYQEATQYWVKATVGLPYYAKNGNVGAPAHGRYFYFSDAQRAHAACAVLNSSLFYSYFIAYGDCFHLSDTLASAFPLTPEMLADRALADANRKLMADLRSNAERKTIDTSAGDKISYDEYSVVKSKMLLDRIDLILATHFGFSPVEADAVVNYDIRYRMGAEDNGEDE